MSGDDGGCHNQGVLLAFSEQRPGFPSTPYTEQFVTTKNYLVQRVNRAKTDKP